MKKRKIFIVSTSVFVLLFCVAAVIVLFVLSPSHPRNITDETVIQKGVEYKVQLSGIYSYDETGFSVMPNGFFYNSENALVYKDEDGYARTTYDGKGESYVTGKYNSTVVLYDDYSFCGDTYKNRQELEDFFETPDKIYNFDIDKIPEYIQNIINYEKLFYGEMTVRIYRGRCVITEVFIGNEKILVRK